MSKSRSLMFFFVFYLLFPLCLTDLTGLHYFDTINCSSSDIYIPQGPYLFSHHWPFQSITIQYHRQLTIGTCQRDGSLYFILNNNKICLGLYQNGHAELYCQAEHSGDYCFIDMQTSDGSQLTCDIQL